MLRAMTNSLEIIYLPHLGNRGRIPEFRIKDPGCFSRNDGTDEALSTAPFYP